MAPVFPGISFLENQTPSLAFSCYVIYIVIKSEYFTKKSLDTFLVSLYYFTSTKKRGDTMAWNLNSDRPIFIQIVERIEMDIISGKYKPGDKLPSVRDLAAEAAVNPNTMQKAFTELERTGLVFPLKLLVRSLHSSNVPIIFLLSWSTDHSQNLIFLKAELLHK